MIRTSADFLSQDKKLNQLYRRACDVLCGSLSPFGDREMLTERPAGNRISLLSGILGAETLASYDLPAALDCVMAFFVSRREDGRLASAIVKKDEQIAPKYEKLTNLCFIDEAIGLFYLSKKKETPYLERLYRVLLDFDAYLWSQHNVGADGLLALLAETDAEEEGTPWRFAPLKLVQSGKVHEVSPFPIESPELMALAYAVREAIAECTRLLGLPDDKVWTEKAAEVKEKLREAFWNEEAAACFDRDYRGGSMEHLTLSCLSLLYYGAADEEMASEILQKHILNPDEFWTPMPLPTVAASSEHFVSEKVPSFSGAARTLSYRRAIRALEKYGQYSTLTALGKKLLAATAKDCVFPVQFDPMSGEATGYSDDYMPAASAVLEFIKRFFGVYVEKDSLCFGTLGALGEEGSEYHFRWGGDEYVVHAEQETTAVYLSGKHLLTVTRGTRVFTDIFGNFPRVVNVTDEPLDCIFVHKNRTYSFTLAPNEMWQEKLQKKK